MKIFLIFLEKKSIAFQVNEMGISVIISTFNRVDLLR